LFASGSKQHKQAASAIISSKQQQLAAAASSNIAPHNESNVAPQTEKQTQTHIAKAMQRAKLTSNRTTHMRVHVRNGNTKLVTVELMFKSPGFV
jgi:hypothetical protein